MNKILSDTFIRVGVIKNIGLMEEITDKVELLLQILDPRGKN